jgi:hypothetical protein
MWVVALMAIAVTCFVVYVGFGAGYNSRRYVTYAMEDAGRLKSDVTDFRRANKRWPDAAEALKMPGAKALSRDVESIVYDAERKAVVITMGHRPYEGKRFGFFAEERDGKPDWSCRTIDLDPKYLPAGCRS